MTYPSLPGRVTYEEMLEAARAMVRRPSLGRHNGKTVMTERAVPTVFIDNERVRVTEWRFAPGAATGWHRHAMDYAVVPLADGVLELVEPGGGRRRAELRHGVPYFRNAGVEHDVINANPYEFAFVEIELKPPA